MTIAIWTIAIACGLIVGAGMSAIFLTTRMSEYKDSIKAQYKMIGTLNVELTGTDTNIYLGFNEKPETLTDKEKICLEVNVISQD